MALANANGSHYIPVVDDIVSRRDNITRGSKMNIMGKYREWRSYRRTVNELSALSNRELNDLGISRGDIPHVARRAR